MIEINLKKGFNLNLYGESEELFIECPHPEKIALKPTDFQGVKPKLSVSIGTNVKIGSILFYDRNNENVKFTSPASGKIEDIIRGDRRVIEAIIIKTDNKKQVKQISFPKKNFSKLNREEILNLLLSSGLFPCFIQRPFGKIASPNDNPRDIFISAINTSPLSPDENLLVLNNEKYFQTGLDIISKLTSGKVYLGINGNRQDNSTAFTEATGVETSKFSGPHPSGNVGVHIHHISPIKGKNDIVWTCNIQSVIWIGKFFQTGKLSFDKIISVTGSSAKGRAYYKTIQGASLDNFMSQHTPVIGTRFISGDVLTGAKIDHNGFIGFYDNMVTVIPEPDPDKFEFLGWALPGFEKFSRSMTYLSNYIRFGNKFSQTATTNGARRTFIATGIYKEVLPMDIYPIFLLKSIYGSNIEEMEELGIYEIIEEDLALCEYIDPSKNDIQQLLREGLNLAEKEG